MKTIEKTMAVIKIYNSWNFIFGAVDLHKYKMWEMFYTFLLINISDKN